MDVLDHYLALPAELQYMIYNMLPRCTQRAMDNEPFQSEFLDCVKQNHIGCVRHLIQTAEFNRLYYCMYDRQLLNWAVENRYSEMLKILVKGVVKRAAKCSHGFCWSVAALHLEYMKDGDKKNLISKCIKQIIKHNTDYVSDEKVEPCHKRRRIN